jgi:DNA repair ATPase RecN
MKLEEQLKKMKSLLNENKKDSWVKTIKRGLQQAKDVRDVNSLWDEIADALEKHGVDVSDLERGT